MVCRNLQVGSPQDAEVERGVSGGERKRTQIGMELVPRPRVLYLDEPTSGLDAFMAATVMKLLQKSDIQQTLALPTVHDI